MAFSKTPTTTATINISSGNLTSNPVDLYCSFTMLKDGSRTVGLDITSGLQRMNVGTTTAALILTASQYDDNEGGMVFIKNLSTTIGEHLILTCGSVIGRVQPGAACLIPWGGNTNFQVTQGTADMEWEYQYFGEKEE
jgi:hypothetical protein